MLFSVCFCALAVIFPNGYCITSIFFTDAVPVNAGNAFVKSLTVAFISNMPATKTVSLFSIEEILFKLKLLTTISMGLSGINCWLRISIFAVSLFIIKLFAKIPFGPYDK